MASAAVIPPRTNSRRSLVVGGPLLSPKPSLSPKPGLKQQQQPPVIRCDEVPPPTLEQMVALKKSLLKRQFSTSSSVHPQPRELHRKINSPILLQPTPSSPDNTLFDFLLDFSSHDAPPDESQSNNPSQNSNEQFHAVSDTPLSSDSIDHGPVCSTDDRLACFESNQVSVKDQATLPTIQSNLNEEFANYERSQPSSGLSSPHASPVLLADAADGSSAHFPTFDLSDWSLPSTMPMMPAMPPLFTIEEAEQLALDLFGDAGAGLTGGLGTSLDFGAVTPSAIQLADVFPPSITSSMEEDVVFVPEDLESDADGGGCVGDHEEAQQTNEAGKTYTDDQEQGSTTNVEIQQRQATHSRPSSPTKQTTSTTHTASTDNVPSNAKRARGRPRRDPATFVTAQSSEGASVEPVIKRPRGRPRKVVDPNAPMVTAAKKRKASASVVSSTTAVIVAEPEVGVPSAVDVGKEEGVASDAEDEDISWMMKMAEAAAMGKELPKRTTPLVTSEEDAAKLSLHKFRPQRPMAPDLAHQYLALKNPELDSKQRRQLRNKLSARSFRERRKEYIDSIEQELRRIVGENAAQKRELEAVREERDALKREVEGLRGRMVGLKIEEKEGDDMELDDGNIGNLSTFSRENLKQEGHALTVRSALMPDFAHVFASMEDGALPGVREFLREHDEIEVLKGLQGDRSMPHASRAEVSGKEAVEWVMKTFDAIRNMAFPESYCVKHAGGVDEVDFDDTETLFGEDGSDLQAVSVGASDQEVYFDNDSDDESLNGEAEDMDDGLGPIERLMMALNMSQSPAWK